MTCRNPGLETKKTWYIMQLHHLSPHEAHHLLATGMARHCHELWYRHCLGRDHQRSQHEATHCPHGWYMGLDNALW